MRAALHQHVIVGGKTMSGGGPPIEARFPLTGERVAWLSGVSAKVMDDAIAAAHEAAIEYRRVPAARRADLLARVAELLAAQRDELAEQLTLETGQTQDESRLECEQAIGTFRLAAEEAVRIDGEVVPLDGVPDGAGRLGEVRRFPVGPVAAITPFSSPLRLAAHKVAPALAAGNPVLLKPSSATPLSGLAIGRAVVEAAEEVGVPAAVVSVVPCADAVVEPLVNDPRVRVLSFTGSSRIGWALRSVAGRKRVVLELGGNGAVIVHRDADIERAAERCVTSAFGRAGQTCASVQRVYAHESIADALTRLMVTLAEGIVLGDPREGETTLGPMRSEEEAKRVDEWLTEAAAGGARILCGGAHDGPLFQPTVLTDTQHRMRVVCDEVLAPVVVVERFSELGDAIDAANGSEYGLQAGIFSNDLAAVYRAYAELEVGAVVVNDTGGWRADSMPHGGVKGSGIGREGVRYAIRELTEPRLLVIDTEGQA